MGIQVCCEYMYKVKRYLLLLYMRSYHGDSSQLFVNIEGFVSAARVWKYNTLRQIKPRKLCCFWHSCLWTRKPWSFGTAVNEQENRRALAQLLVNKKTNGAFGTTVDKGESHDSFGKVVNGLVYHFDPIVDGQENCVAFGTIVFVSLLVQMLKYHWKWSKNWLMKPRNMKYQGVKEFHMLARIGCYCNIIVFSPFKVKVTYYYPLNEWLLGATNGNYRQTVMHLQCSETINHS